MSTPGNAARESLSAEARRETAVFLRRLILAPVEDYLRGLDACLQQRHSLFGAALAVVASWWVYVPLHELAHAFGCLVAGGEVTRLEIDAIYGARLLSKVFPFVAVGSEYAGQLTGFDTHGSSFTYLVTDFAPFLLTIFVGVPLLRSAGRGGRSAWNAAIRLGAAVPVAYAPFLSLTGDYYEMGSILVSDAARLVGLGDRDYWRSDDIFRLWGEVFGEGKGSALDMGGIILAFLLGTVLAWLTYALGSAWSAWWEARSARPTTRLSGERR